MFPLLCSLGEDIHHVSRDTFGSEWGVINKYARMIHTSQECPGQTRHDPLSWGGRGGLWPGLLGMEMMLEGWA